jgi:hypothetical protein
VANNREINTKLKMGFLQGGLIKEFVNDDDKQKEKVGCCPRHSK